MLGAGSGKPHQRHANHHQHGKRNGQRRPPQPLQESARLLLQLFTQARAQAYVEIRRRCRCLPLIEQRHGLAECLQDRKSTRLNSSHTVISYAVFCLKKKTIERVVGTEEYSKRTKKAKYIRSTTKAI